MPPRRGERPGANTRFSAVFIAFVLMLGRFGVFFLYSMAFFGSVPFGG